MGRRIGIDLGTTNSVVAVCDGPRPRVLDNREGKLLTPSMVSYRKRKGVEELIVGAVSYDYWEFDPKNTVNSVKRLMGRGFKDRQVQEARERTRCQYEIVEPTDGTSDSLCVVLGDKEYSPVDISAEILGKLKADAEHRLGGEAVTDAVVTVPAYFSQIQRDATRAAVVQAGMRVIKILDEPTAAAIAYGMDSADAEEVKTILVYDLGGGTFDISVLLLSGGVFAQVNLEGDMWLGGDDFDQVLVDYAVDLVKRQHGADPTTDPKAMIKLKKAARNAKEALSSSKSADLIVAGLMQNEDGEYVNLDEVVSNSQYVEMIRPLVQRTVTLVEKAIKNAQFTDEESGALDLSQIDYVLMAGNGTLVPLVQQVMEDMFGREKILRRENPKYMVALGAAIFAVIDHNFCAHPDPDDPTRECGHPNPPEATECERCHRPLVAVGEKVPAPTGEGKDEEEEVVIGHGGVRGVQHVAPFHYGMQSAGDVFNVFIRKGDPYETPQEARQPQVFYTRLPNMPMISIPVYGGDNLDSASANEPQGEAFAMLPPGLARDTPIHITIWLDDGGVFQVAAELDDGTDLHPEILKGGIESQVKDIMQRVDEALAEKGSGLSPDEREKLDAQKNAAWEKMRQNDFKAARDEARKLEEMIASSGGRPADLESKAENLIGFAEAILGRYGWAFRPDAASKLSNLVEETRNALKAGDAQLLEQKVKELDQATDQIPDVVKLLLGLTIAIATRVQPYDMALATKFSERLADIEKDLKASDVTAIQKLNSLATDLTAAIEEFGKRHKFHCSRGHEVPAGKQFCPQCGEDVWVPSASKTSVIPSSL